MLALGVARFDSVAFNFRMVSMGAGGNSSTEPALRNATNRHIFAAGVGAGGHFQYRSAPPRPEVAAAKPAAHRDLLGCEKAPTSGALAVK